MGASPVIKVVAQREDSDCGIAALAMYLGESYEDVLREVTVLDRHQGRQGLWRGTMQRVAARLGTKLRLRRRVDWESDYGILRLPDHAAVLRNGLVFETDGSVWDCDAYLAHRRTLASECEVLIATEE